MSESNAPEAAPLEIFIEGSCPAPVLGCAKALRRLPSGAELVVKCLDPASVADLAAFSRQSGNTLLQQTEERHGEQVVYCHRLRRK